MNTRLAVRITRVTLHQFQWLDERGILSPKRLPVRRGVIAPRDYEMRELLQAMVLRAARRRGISLHTLRAFRQPMTLALKEYVSSPEGELYFILDRKRRELWITRSASDVIRRFVIGEGLDLIVVSDHWAALERACRKAGV